MEYADIIEYLMKRYADRVVEFDFSTGYGIGFFLAHIMNVTNGKCNTDTIVPLLLSSIKKEQRKIKIKTITKKKKKK